MAEDVLAVEKRKAGEDYLAALRSLGFEPEALFWAKDAVVGNDVLILVTSLFDYAGPFDLSGLLFKAYNLSATPREVDPFIVRLNSPNHASILEFARMFGKIIQPPLYAYQDKFHGPDHRVKISGVSMGADVDVYTDAIYKFDLTRRSATIDASRKWRRFQERVDKLAA